MFTAPASNGLRDQPYKPPPDPVWLGTCVVSGFSLLLLSNKKQIKCFVEVSLCRIPLTVVTDHVFKSQNNHFQLFGCIFPPLTPQY